MDNKLLYTVLALVLVLYVLFFTYLIVRYVIPRNKSSKNQQINQSSDFGLTDLPATSFNTDFFKKSADHAESILQGKTFTPEYGDPSYFGNKLLDMLGKINSETKKNIIFCIRYMMIEPAQSRTNEQLFRMMSEQERVPLWYIILRECSKKIVPEYSFSESSNIENKIIPITSHVA